jgi:outer membrane protein TolC
MTVAAPILQWNPIDFGRTLARIGQAKAARDEALADYRKAVLAALEDAETGLSRYARQREDVIGLARVKASADRAAALTDLRIQGGTASTLDILDAERRRVDAESGLEQARAEVTRDYVSLQKSLGLGWNAPGPG